MEARLKQNLPWFDMTDFLQLLKEKNSESSEPLEGDIFELLESLGDFQAFKELVLNYKQEKEGNGFNFNDLLEIKPGC